MIADPKRPATKHKGRIRDARGRKVEQIDPLTIHLLQQRDIIEADALKAIVREDDLRIMRSERAFFIVGLLAMLVVVGLFLYSMIFKGLSNAPYAKTVALVYFAVVPWFIWYLIRRSRFSKIAPIMLKHHRCAHCGYDLRGLPSDAPDGATVCPECGCAWKLQAR